VSVTTKIAELQQPMLCDSLYNTLLPSNSTAPESPPLPSVLSKWERLFARKCVFFKVTVWRIAQQLCLKKNVVSPSCVSEGKLLLIITKILSVI